MTRSENRYPLLAVVAVLAAGSLHAHADNLLFGGDERLSGNVRSITPEGSVLLETPLSPDPVAIKAESVRKIVFSEPAGKAPDTGNCLIALTNGDSLPGTIGEVNGDTVTLDSGAAGQLVVPRTAVVSIQPGLEHPTLVYSGPDGLAGWKIDGNSDEQWTADKDFLRVEGGGAISRSLELPENFIVRFRITWGKSPNLNFSFAADQADISEAQNRYNFMFNSAGMQIRRESTVDKRWSVITSLNRLPTQFDPKSVLVEIRVDRAARQLQLWINGELEGKYVDSAASAPAGNLIVFASNAGDGEVQTLYEIQVLDWNLKTDRRPMGERGDKSQDLLIGVDGERFSGNLLQTRHSEEGLLYVFKNAFQEQPIEVPEKLVSAIYLADAPPAVAEAQPNVILKLRGGASLQVGECTFSPERVTALHPLLGQIKLERAAVATFERKATVTKKDPAKS